MYHSYNSLRDSIQKEIENQKSVLNKFPENISRPITQSVSKHLSQFTSYQLPFKSEKLPQQADTANSKHVSANLDVSNNQSSDLSSSNLAADTTLNTNLNENNSNNNSGNDITNLNANNNDDSGNNTNNELITPASTANSTLVQNNSNNNLNNDSSLEKINIIQLETPEQVNWTLENLMYGLTLSHDHQDIIKDCWNVYHDWLSVLLDEQKPFVPQPIKDEPILYSKKMLWHLYHLFVPRKDSTAPTKHIMMCHGVLILIEGIAKDSKLLKRDLWEDFLKFFLAINDAVLAPPFNKDDFGEVLSSRIVATLFEIWLIACNKVFPSPSVSIFLN